MATVSAQRALSVLFTSCQFVMLLSIFYEQLNDDDLCSTEDRAEVDLGKDQHLLTYFWTGLLPFRT